MTRPRNAKKTATEKPRLSLVTALDFVSKVQSRTPTDQLRDTHCRLVNNYAVGFNGVVALGYPIEEQINAIPHTFKLLSILKKAKGALTITQVDPYAITIKSNKLKAVIPCLNASAIPYVEPVSYTHLTLPTKA